MEIWTKQSHKTGKKIETEDNKRKDVGKKRNIKDQKYITNEGLVVRFQKEW